MSQSPAHSRQRSGDQYYEDIEPRFAEENTGPPSGTGGVPSVLMAGRSAGEIPSFTSSPNPRESPSPPPPPPPLNIPHDAIAAGLGPSSPASSDISQGSHFTSISERPINPRWQESVAPSSSLPVSVQNRGPRIQDVVSTNTGCGTRRQCGF